MSKDYGGGYGKTDAAKDTNVSTSHVSGAWHEARNQARQSGEIPKKYDSGALEKFVDFIFGKK